MNYSITPAIAFIGIVAIVSLLVWGANEDRKQTLARHRQQMADCQQTGKERLWCEGLLK